MFRGWLSGKARAVVMSLAALGLFYLAPYLIMALMPEVSGYSGLIAFITATILLLIGAPIDRGSSLPAYDLVFPFLFWGQSILFGLLHIQNYAALSLPLAFMAILPLVACGVIWGYARTRLGLGWAILLHSFYNVPSAFVVVML